MTKQTFQATKSLIKQTPSSYFKSNPKIQRSDTCFKVKPTKMLSVCGGGGLRPDPPSPTGVNLLLLLDRIIFAIFARHFLQSFNVEGSRFLWLCLRLEMWLAVCVVSLQLICLSKTLFEEETICFVLYSSPNGTLFSECVCSDKHLSWAIMFVG